MISAQDAREAIWRPLLDLPGRADLIITMVRRDLASRYRGSMLGIVWAVLTPVLMIAIFTFIFAGIFGARFGASGSPWDYALYLFCGLLPWTAFQESVQASATTVVAHSNLVKRVVFPLEILPVAQALSSVANQLFGTLALLATMVIMQHELRWTLVFLPALLLVQTVATLGASWLIASLGVFLRDIVQGVALVLMAWMYLTPIIYPESIVPVRFRPLIETNPFTPLIRSYRAIVLEGKLPDWRGLGFFTLFALFSFCLGYWWFAKTRKNFADVI